MSDEYTPKSLWERALVFFKSDLKTDAERNQMERHFPQFVSHEKKDGDFLIGVSNEQQVEWFVPLYTQPLEHALADAGEPGLHVRFVVDERAASQRTYVPRNPVVSDAEPPVEAKRTIIPQTASPVGATQNATASVSARMKSTLPLDDKFTFSNFVKGPSNNFAYAIATAVAKDPGGTTNNPFFIWGGSGLGKTHLMQAIGHEVMRTRPDKSVCYITSEEFLNAYINAISNDRLAAFRALYRSIDLLLIDDVQFIAGKEQFQEEFFNTYSTLMSFGKQVVMTCDVPPQKLLGLEERLKTRFQQGIVIEIELPSYETRMAILKFKAKSCPFNIPDFALSYIVENICSSIRAMEGALNLLHRFIEANPSMELSTEIIRELLKNLTEEETVKRKLSIEEIIKTVCSFFDVTYVDIVSNNRTQPLATARQVAMFLCRKLTGNSLKTIAAPFNRNHSTVMHGMTNIQSRIETESELKGTISKITEELGRKPSEIFE